MNASVGFKGRLFTSIVVGLSLGLLSVNSAFAVLLTGIDYSQNFDSLAASGTGSTLPPDWHLSESGSNANSTYTAGTGSSSTGETYSFGAAGSTDRALGGVLSGSLSPSFGVMFENGGLTPINSLTISFTGEQWRLGALGRVDRLDFQFSTDATSLATGTWIDVDALDFVAPLTTGTTGAKDGNAAASQTAISSTISGLSVANGGSFWLRWNDFSATGADDGLAIDAFTLSAVFDRPVNPPPTSSVPDAGTTLSLLAASIAGMGFVARRRA